MFLVDTTAPADERIYELKSSNGEFFISILNDAQTSNDSAFLITSASRVGINTLNPDSTLKVGGGVNILGGLRVGNLPTSPGTKQLRINAQGQFSVTDTLIDAGGTVTSVATNNGSGITGGPITTTGTLAIDTTIISTKANVSGGLAGKLNISDTATMLQNYVNSAGYGLGKSGQTVYADSAALSNYYLRRKDSLTATNILGYVTKTVLADTAAAIRSADAGGTVTSVATNNGTGITGGTITTTGTLAIDTLLISTRAWRQKGVDSVAALANTKVDGSGISNYLSKWTGTKTIDTSQFYQSGENIGLGTITPGGRLAVVDTGGFALKINYNSASTDANNNAALYAENNSLSSYVAILNEKTTNNTGGQFPILIESSLSSGTAQSGMATGIHFGTPDDAGNKKVTQLALRTTDPAAATYTNRAELRLWNNGTLSTPYYLLGNGNLGLGTSTPDSNLTVVNGAYFQRGIRASALPQAPGTKALRIDAAGTISYADTLIDAGGTVTSVATNNGTGITGGTITTTGTLAIDTLLISTRAWRQKGIDSVQGNLTSGLALKVNISDTASMLSPYARTVNVRAIIADSLGGLQRLKALSAAGAGIYSNSGTKVAEWGLGGGANFDFHGFAGYDINRAGNYTVRSFTDKNYVDSAISASPSGTVTSVATNTGSGITGGTITTTGTLAIDTLLISTRAWRQKGIDSVQGNLTSGLALKVNISDTASMLSPYARTNVVNAGLALKVNISDTASMLSPYARTNAVNAGLALKVNISDTSSMLSPYLRKVDTTAMLSPYKTFYPRTAISLTTTGTSGAATYNNSTGVLNIPQYADQFTGTVTSVATNNGTGITGGTITTAGTLAIDTLRISTRLWRQKGIDSVQGNLTAGLATKLNISDTASMLLPYLRKVDTASLSNRINLKLNISDTASMLSPYLRSATASATYVPQSRTITINGTAQDLSANRTFSVGTVTSVGLTAGTGISVSGSPVTGSGSMTVTNTAPDQTVVLNSGTGISISGTYPSFTITNSSPSSGGTVTSVGTNNGTGLTGGTITTAGTLAIDTALISTRLWRQKGIDSVQGNLTAGLALKVNISDTSSMLSPYLRKIDTTAMLSPYARKNFINAGTGISYSSSTGTIANTAPDQTVALTGGTGISISGTYPNFTITNSSPSSGGTVTSVGSGTGLTGGPITTSGTLAVDTLLMSTRAWRQKGVDSVQANLTAGLSLKLNISDTANMLSPYLRKVDTTSLSNRINLKLNISDTSSMLTNYFRINGVGLNRAGQTVLADTLLLSTRAWRQKGVDSVAALISSNISGTTNYIPKFTSSSAIGNSQLFENGSKFTYDNSLGQIEFVNTTAANTLSSYTTGAASYNDFITRAATHQWLIGGSEQMRLTSTGLGIGTSSPAEKLDVYDNSASNVSIKVGNTSGALQLLQGNGAAYLYTATNQPLIFSNNNSEKMRLDASGNLGLGVTPTNGTGDVKHFEIASGGRFVAAGNNGEVGANYYYDNDYKYITSNSVTRLEMNGGAFKFYNAPSGTAGNAISFTQAMTLDASGNLGIGYTSPSTYGKLAVNGAGYFGNTLTTAGVLVRAVGTNSTTVSSSTLWSDSAPLMYAENRSTTANTAAGYAMQVGGGNAIAGILGIAESTAQAALGIYTGGTGTVAEKVRITSGGNVGIGTTSPTQKLDVVISSGPYNARFHNSSTSTSDYNVILVTQGASGSATGYFGTGGSAASNTSFANTFVIGTQSNSAFVFNTNDTERMRITSAGNVGIGTTSPSNKLTVNGTNIGIDIQNSGTTYFRTELDGGNTTYLSTIGAYDMILRTNSTEKMRITSGGNVGIGTSSPTQALDVLGIINIGRNQNAFVTNFNINSGSTPISAFQINTDQPNLIAALVSRNSYALTFGTSDTERMRITSGGEVLVGSTSSGLSSSGRGVIEINGTSESILGLKVNNVVKTYLYQSGDNVEFNNTANGYLALKTNASERMRITSGGNVGIGVSSPNTQLQINGTPSNDWGNLTLFDTRSQAADRGGMISFGGYKSTTSTEALFAQIKGNKENGTSGNEAGYLAFFTNNNTTYAERMRITSGGELLINTTSDAGDYKLQVNGNVYAIAYYESSDLRKKNVLSELVGSDGINTITFKWKDGRDSLTHIGYAAQQVEKVLPDAVKTNPDGYKTINYDEVQTLKIANLEKEIAELKEMIKKLIK
jgi:hypothetical protein